MEKPSSTHGRAYVHVGTHKTGTTSIQALLAMNERAFREAGVYIPKSGRIDGASAALHNVAWELSGDPRFDQNRGTFNDVLCEAASENAEVLCLTSEDFGLMHANVAVLEKLRDGLTSIGYEPKVILYLRPQADYAESLYAEVIEGQDIDFGSFLAAVLSEGAYLTSLFDYDRLTTSFAATFGANSMIVRTYRSSASPERLLADFTRIIAPAPIDFHRLTLPRVLNRMTNFPMVVAMREQQVGCTAHHSMAPDQPFDPLGLLDIIQIVARFSRSNERVARAHGARIAAASPAIMLRELFAELLHDRESRHRKRLLRALVKNEENVAAERQPGGLPRLAAMS